MSKITNVGFMVNHSYFFIFVTWISLIIAWILVDIHENVGRKNLNLDGNDGKKNKYRKPHGAKAEPLGLRSGPAWAPGRLIILFLPSMKPPNLQFFCQHFY